MRRKSNGFVMADALVALGILAVCVVWFCIGERQLHQQMRHASEAIQVARIAKEATDQYRLAQHELIEQRGAYQVTVSEHGVTVSKGGHVKLNVQKQ